MVRLLQDILGASTQVCCEAALGSVKYAHTMSASETTSVLLKARKVVPNSEPLLVEDVNLLHDSDPT